MKIFFLIILIYGQASFSSEKDLAIDSIKAIFPSISKKSKIKTKGCSNQKQKWATLILTKQPFKETFKFGPKCDLQGSFTVKMEESFPLKLKVKNHKEISEISSKVKLSLSFLEMPLLTLNMNESLISLKSEEKELRFNMNYGVYVDLVSKNPLKKHKGGSIFIKNIGPKSIRKTYPLKF